MNAWKSLEKSWLRQFYEINIKLNAIRFNRLDCVKTLETHFDRYFDIFDCKSDLYWIFWLSGCAKHFFLNIKNILILRQSLKNLFSMMTYSNLQTWLLNYQKYLFVKHVRPEFSKYFFVIKIQLDKFDCIKNSWNTLFQWNTLFHIFNAIFTPCHSVYVYNAVWPKPKLVLNLVAWKSRYALYNVNNFCAEGGWLPIDSRNYNITRLFS